MTYICSNHNRAIKTNNILRIKFEAPYCQKGIFCKKKKKTKVPHLQVVFICTIGQKDVENDVAADMGNVLQCHPWHSSVYHKHGLFSGLGYLHEKASPWHACIIVKLFVLYMYAQTLSLLISFINIITGLFYCVTHTRGMLLLFALVTGRSFPYPEPVHTGWSSVHWNATKMPLVDPVYTGISLGDPANTCRVHHWKT